VDTAAVRIVAARFDTAADILSGTLSGLRFDGAAAGRAHVAHGDAVRAAVERLAAVLAQWSRAAAEIAAALRADADRYGEAELRAVAVLQ
jgi:hypothetical protein